MDINRLNEFITLATLLNYSKAANQLYLTQPALSRHIHDLEQTLGTQLFIRDTHRRTENRFPWNSFPVFPVGFCHGVHRQPSTDQTLYDQ